MVYYEDHKAKLANNPIGYVPLQTASSFEVTPNPKGPLSAFQITTTEPDRVWNLRCDNEEEMHRWMNACILHAKWSKETMQTTASSKLVGKVPVSTHTNC